MKTPEFDQLLIERIVKIKTILGSKAAEYAQDGDRLYNFKVAGRMIGVPPAEALWGMAVKHLVSVQDLVDEKLDRTHALIDEKIGDMINYLILLEALLKEHADGT